MDVSRGTLGKAVFVILGVAVCTTALAQSVLGPEISSPRGEWQRRATRPARSSTAEIPRVAAGTRSVPAWSPERESMGVPVLTAAAEPIPTPAPSAPKPPETIRTPSPVPVPAPVPAPDTGGVPGDVVYEPLGTEGGPFDHTVPHGGACDVCGGGYSPCDDCGEPCCPDCGCHGAHCRECFRFFFRHLAFFAGVQGFKGPLDLGRNGNFGFHEGVNWSGPLGDPWRSGYQVGIRGVHSNFLGNQVSTTNNVPIADDNSRDQIFVTVGLFNRALEGGLQGGVAFDYLHDNYYDQADLKQLRSETSFVAGPHELGFFGAYDVGGQSLFGRTALTPIQPNDVYTLFYRRHFSGGGQGRAWVGASGHSEWLVGAEASVPLGTNWSLENSFVYLIPDEQRDESWSVAFSLVFYPGRASRCVFRNPYTALFNVADNGTFLIRRQGETR